MTILGFIDEVWDLNFAISSDEGSLFQAIVITKTKSTFSSGQFVFVALLNTPEKSRLEYISQGMLVGSN